MKKFTQTIVIFLMTIAFTNLNAAWLDIQGQISPVNSPISVNITYEDGGSYFSASVMTDGAGNFIHSDTINSSQGFTSISFNDCTGSLQSDTVFYYPTGSGIIADYGVIANCTNSNNDLTVMGTITNFPANFTVNLSYDYGVTFSPVSVNSSGAFSDAIQVSSLVISHVVMTFTDCGGTVQTDSAQVMVALVGYIADFGNIDYCSISSTGVSGSFFNVSGNFNYSISIDNGATYQSYSFIDTANPTGFFSNSYSSFSTSGVALIQYTDCNGATITDTTTNISGSPTQEIFNFGNIDLCPNTNPNPCSAGFSLSQNVIIDSFNNIVSSGNVMVVNTSIGQNISYSWDFGDNSPTYTGVNFTHTYASAGPWVLCLTVTDASGSCSDTFCDSLMVDSSGVLTGKTNGGFTIEMGTGEDNTNGPNSINELANQIDVTLFPNPASSIISLQLNSKINDEATIVIYNALGSLVKQETTEVTKGNQTVKINIEALNTGLFIIQLMTNEGTISKKFLKK